MRRRDFILFDLDGTISNPVVGFCRSINYALSSLGVAELSESEVGRFIGPPLDEAFRAIIGGGAAGMIEQLVFRYRERYATVGYAENELYSGIPEALSALRDAGFLLGVCTSKRRDFAVRILSVFGLLELFEFVDGGDIGIHKWGQVEGLIGRGQVTRPAVLIGDRAADLVAAHRNGLSAAGALWGYGSREELTAENPRYLLASPEEIVSVVAASLS